MSCELMIHDDASPQASCLAELELPDVDTAKLAGDLLLGTFGIPSARADIFAGPCHVASKSASDPNLARIRRERMDGRRDVIGARSQGSRAGVVAIVEWTDGSPSVRPVDFALIADARGNGLTDAMDHALEYGAAPHEDCECFGTEVLCERFGCGL